MLNIVLWRLHAVVVVVALLFFLYKLLLLLTGRQEPLRRLRARTRYADSLLLGAGLLTFGAAALTYAGPLSSWLWFPVLQISGLLLFFIRALRQERQWPASLLLLVVVALCGTQVYGALAVQWPHEPNLLRQALLGEAPNAAAVAAAAPATAAGQPETTATPDADAPIEAAAPAGLSAADVATLAVATAQTSPPNPELAAGRALFVKNCVACHGANGQRGLNGAHDLTKSNLNTAGRVYLVTNGLGKMPAFRAKLTDAQIQQVVAYSLTLR